MNIQGGTFTYCLFGEAQKGTCPICPPWLRPGRYPRHLAVKLTVLITSSQRLISVFPLFYPAPVSCSRNAVRNPLTGRRCSLTGRRGDAAGRVPGGAPWRRAGVAVTAGACEMGLVLVVAPVVRQTALAVPTFVFTVMKDVRFASRHTHR